MQPRYFKFSDNTLWVINAPFSLKSERIESLYNYWLTAPYEDDTFEYFLRQSAGSKSKKITAETFEF